MSGPSFTPTRLHVFTVANIICLHGAVSLAVHCGRDYKLALLIQYMRTHRCREILRNSPTALRLLKSALNAAEDGHAGLQVNPYILSCSMAHLHSPCLESVSDYHRCLAVSSSMRSASGNLSFLSSGVSPSTGRCSNHAEVYGDGWRQMRCLSQIFENNISAHVAHCPAFQS